MSLFLRRAVILVLGVFATFGWLVAIPFMLFIGWIIREPWAIEGRWWFREFGQALREGKI